MEANPAALKEVKRKRGLKREAPIRGALGASRVPLRGEPVQTEGRPGVFTISPVPRAISTFYNIVNPHKQKAPLGAGLSLLETSLLEAARAFARCYQYR